MPRLIEHLIAVTPPNPISKPPSRWLLMSSALRKDSTWNYQRSSADATLPSRTPRVTMTPKLTVLLRSEGLQKVCATATPRCESS